MHTPQQRLPVFFNGLDNIAPSCTGISTPSNTWFLGPIQVSPKWHLDRFSHFYRAHPYDQHTDRQTTLRTTSVAKGHIHAMHAMRPKMRVMHNRETTWG